MTRDEHLLPILDRVLDAHQNDIVREFERVRDSIGEENMDDLPLDRGALWSLRGKLQRTVEAIDDELVPAAGIDYWVDNEDEDDVEALEAELDELVADVVEQHEREAGLQDIPDFPPECVEWLDHDHGVIQIEATRPFISWLQAEADEQETTVEDWIRTQLFHKLTNDLNFNHGDFGAAIDIDLPEDFAQRVAWYVEDRRLRGDDVEDYDIETFTLNHLKYDYEFTLGGEPWLLADLDDDRNGGGVSAD